MSAQEKSLFESIMDIHQWLRAYAKDVFALEWAEISSYLHVAPQDAQLLDSLEKCFEKKWERHQIIATLAYLALVQNPEEARLTLCDFSLLLWIKNPTRRNEAPFKELVMELFDLSQLESRWFSVLEELNDWEHKKLHKLCHDLQESLPTLMPTVRTGLKAA